MDKRPLLALASGTLGLGIAEFVMMGLLPYVAADMGATIPEAGRLISAYAVGVCVGAPLTTLIAFRRPLKGILLSLAVIYIIGNAMAFAAQSYAMLLAARFVSGLPHGAFFGVGSIVAGRIGEGGRDTLAISIMNAGMTVANVVGVPLGTWLAVSLSWRSIFAVASAWGVVTMAALWLWIPRQEPLPDTGLKGQFRFLRHAPALYVIGATMFSNGAIFCWYSYILPQMNSMAGLGDEWRTALMVLAGAGMVAGNLAGGRLAVSHAAARVDMYGQLLAMALLLCMAAFADVAVVAVALMVALAGLLFSFSPAQQSLILKHSCGGQMMAASFIQIAFNLGNALGAHVGGLPIEAGLGYRFPPLIGAGVMSLGVMCLWLYNRRENRTDAQAAQTD
ncbi:MAG: MFS transporter [Bacteroidales bacterium]|nr:MFS transporter [Bacteroidales bacterium]